MLTKNPVKINLTLYFHFTQISRNVKSKYVYVLYVIYVCESEGIRFKYIYLGSFW